MVQQALTSHVLCNPRSESPASSSGNRLTNIYGKYGEFGSWEPKVQWRWVTPNLSALRCTGIPGVGSGAGVPPCWRKSELRGSFLQTSPKDTFSLPYHKTQYSRPHARHVLTAEPHHRTQEHQKPCACKAESTSHQAATELQQELQGGLCLHLRARNPSDPGNSPQAERELQAPTSPSSSQHDSHRLP